MRSSRKAREEEARFGRSPLIILVVTCLITSVGAAVPPCLDESGDPLSFKTDEEAVEFLLTARVVSSEGVSTGLNEIKKVSLEKDGVRCNAAFRDMRVHKDKIELEDGSIQFNFRDDYIFECAAYELSRLLGLDNVPPAVKRKLFRKVGSLQLWVENAKTEGQRKKEGQRPPDDRLWERQTQVMRIFDNLIYNEDRNPGNILYDSEWKMWLIDHSRAFRRHSRLKKGASFDLCERGLWEKLQSLSKEDFKGSLGRFLHPAELKGLLKRRDLIVSTIQELIDLKGEEKVLFEVK